MHYLITGARGLSAGTCRGCSRRTTSPSSIISTGNYDNVANLEGRPKFALVIDTIAHERLMEDLAPGRCGVPPASAVGVRLIIGARSKPSSHRPRHRHRPKLASAIAEGPAYQHSEVYGKSANVPFDEDGDRLEGPTSKHRWAYACAKALDEFLALAHWKESRLPVVCARLFNTVGPRQTGRYGMVVPRFVQSALSGEPIVVHGDGQQTRCFCHVLDVVEALVQLMQSRAADGQVVNVGSQEEVTIAELARRVVALVGSESAIRQVPYSEVFGEGFEDMRRRVPSLDKIHRLIGWQPVRA